MLTMLNEEGYSFKEIEQEIFRMVCEWGQVFTKTFLEEYDTYLMNIRDKEVYRNKGLKTTAIKTVYGEVTYQRRIYEVTREDGLKEYVFLLDEQLRIPGVGLISQNLADQLVSGITEMYDSLYEMRKRLKILKKRRNTIWIIPHYLFQLGILS